ncbi:MAG TPA: hypothetical protein VG056_01940 [Pirellulales bacterium]|jgi:hypothetical protein|nr:hypothetical protein [Pirellulales bacterium]
MNRFPAAVVAVAEAAVVPAAAGVAVPEGAEARGPAAEPRDLRPPAVDRHRSRAEERGRRNDRVPGPAGPARVHLRAHGRQLVRRLALGPAPETSPEEADQTPDN